MIHLALSVAVAAAGVCHPVRGTRIQGQDLALAVPSMAAIPPSALIGYSPVPGSRRVFRAVEVAAIAKKYGLDDPSATEVCFEWPAAPLTPPQLLEALRKSLGNGDFTIEVLDFDRRPVPPGDLVFPRSNLVPQAHTKSFLWRGYLSYAENRRVATWVQAKITRRGQRVVADQPLRSGEPILQEQVRLETVEDSGVFDKESVTLDDVIGKVPRRSFASGSVVRRSLLGPSKVIAKGETLQLDVRSGAVRFRMEGRAESDGRLGDVIMVRNLASGKSFRARVEGPGKVHVSGLAAPAGRAE